MWTPAERVLYAARRPPCTTIHLYLGAAAISCATTHLTLRAPRRFFVGQAGSLLAACGRLVIGLPLAPDHLSGPTSAACRCVGQAVLRVRPIANQPARVLHGCDMLAGKLRSLSPCSEF